MNKMKLRILICALLIATAVPAVESLKNSTIKATVPSHPLARMDANLTKLQKLLALHVAAHVLSAEISDGGA
jgi:hypothetical protein